MKYLSLQQAMLGMRVTMTDDGVILKSPAGSAHYDVKGRRHTVKGNAEFLPMHLRVKGKRKPDLSRVVFDKDSTTIYGPDGKAQVRMGNLENTEKPKGWRIGDGEVFISNAFIGNDMSISVEDGRRKVVEAAQSIIGNAAAITAKTKISLSDEMTQAVIDAVRESDLFTSLQTSIHAQTASLTALQQAMHDAVNDAIRNALKPGGAIWVQQRAS